VLAALIAYLIIGNYFAWREYSAQVLSRMSPTHLGTGELTLAWLINVLFWLPLSLLKGPQ
jgi:hypothetical protein